MASEYYVGIDVGSQFVHPIVLDQAGKLIYAPESRMHLGDTVDSIKQVYDQVTSEMTKHKLHLAFTGSGGKVVSETIRAPFFHDTITIPLGTDFISPETRYVFHIGARDSYFFEKDKIRTNGKARHYVPDNATGTKCGGGSGILLTKQCKRFFEDQVSEHLPTQQRLEKMYQRAEQLINQATKQVEIGGRCGVVIQSDMIHAQNSGEDVENIFRGLVERLAENFQVDVIGIRDFYQEDKAVATGGLARIPYFVKMLEKHLGLQIETPEHHEKVGALGAALLAIENNVDGFCFERLEDIVEAERSQLTYAPPLNASLERVTFYPEPTPEKRGDLNIFTIPEKTTPVVMGVDGGSTTTKAVLLTSDKLDPVAEICLETHGKPLESAQNVFGQINRNLGDLLDIQAVAYTGSAGAFYYKMFTNPKSDPDQNPDLVIDEITCHVLGVRHFNPDVDTIYELGGQDAKFTRLKGDSVKKSKMNLSCMAGTGQTMQNMIGMVGLDFSEFEKQALRAKRTPIVDETCGVFTEAGIAHLVSLGLPTDQIAAAIAYGFLGGFVNKFVGNEKIGDCISAQGGPFNSRACLAALAAHTGKQINAFPHRQLFGAYGAALAAHENLQENLK